MSAAKSLGGRGVAVELRDHQQRAVVAGAEPVGQLVVGRTGGGAAGVVAGIGGGEAHGERRHDQCAEQAHADAGAGHGMALHEAAPTVPPRLALAVTAAVHRHPVDAVADEPECGGQQRERREHRHQDSGRGAQRQAVEERHAHQQHAQQRDHHGDTGEHDGTPSGVDGFDGSFQRCGAPV
jgi:hypothetical protein